MSRGGAERDRDRENPTQAPYCHPSFLLNKPQEKEES